MCDSSQVKGDNGTGTSSTLSYEESETSNQSTTSSQKEDKNENVVQEQENKEDISGGMSTLISSGLTDKDSKQIALTFDSGWLYENTEELLNILYENNVKATFFARGLWVEDHPELAKAIVEGGNYLENHSLTHGHMTEMSDTEIENEINASSDIITRTTGYKPYLFRPPYGEYDERMLTILKEKGYPYTVLWTVDSHDWAEELNGVKITKEYLVDRVLGNASDNGIILMHVGGYETINALPEIITGLRSQGYELVSVNSMLPIVGFQ
jgi:peptidoglycan/xylan/chitin deacetylase (PgdA/CDA1 family)